MPMSISNLYNDLLDASRNRIRAEQTWKEAVEAENRARAIYNRSKLWQQIGAAREAIVELEERATRITIDNPTGEKRD